MSRRVRIRKLPNKAQGGATSGASEGLSRFMEGKKTYDQGMNQFAAPDFEVNKTLKPVPEDEANIEAEKGEVAIVPGMGGIPESFVVGGERHNSGGTKLNLAPDSFIFSDHKKGMLIKDKDILAEFGMSVPKKGRVKGYTPGQIAKKYDLNEYKKLLLDPNTDKIEKETSEDMIGTYNLKLGKLALVQESMKGFPQGIPAIAMPYIESLGIDPQQFLPQEEVAAQGGQQGMPPQGMQQGPPQEMMAQGPPQQGPPMQNYGGSLDKFMQEGGPQGPPMQQGPPQGPPPDQGQQGQPSPEEIMQQIAQALQQEVPPEEIMQSLVQMGVPEEQAQQMIEMVMQEMQGQMQQQGAPQGPPQQEGAVGPPQQQPPMAAYGAGVTGDPSQYSYQNGGAQEFTGAFWDSISQNGGTLNKFISYQDGGEQSKREARQWDNLYNRNLKSAWKTYLNEQGLKRNDLKFEDWMQEVETSNPEIIQKAMSMTDQGQGSDLRSQIKETVQGVGGVQYNIQADGTYTPIEQTPIANIDDPSTYNTNPEITSEYPITYRYDKVTNKVTRVEPEATSAKNTKPGKEEVKTSTKSTSTYNVPDQYKDNPIYDKGSASYDESAVKDGDYVKEGDKWFKVKEGAESLSHYSGSGAEAYKPVYGSIEEDVKKAKAIMDKDPKSFLSKNGKYDITRAAADNISLEDKDFLTKVFSYRTEKGGLGALDLQVGTQHGDADAFYGFVDPELIEYRHWKARNPEGTASDFGKLGDTEKLANRTSYLTDLDYTPEEIAEFESSGKLSDPSKLYTEDFMKGDKGFTARNQMLFSEKDFRPGLGDDFKYGLEHVDDYRFKKGLSYDELDPETTPDIPANKPDFFEHTPRDEWWAQDIGNIAQLAGQRANLNKYLPHSQAINLAKPDVLYYDPTRALASNSEATKVASDAAKAFSGAKSTYRQSALAGEQWKRSADILGGYEDKNIVVGNQYLDKVQQTANQETLANSQRLDKMYDQTTIANQQFDNAKRQANRNLFDGWRQGLTNKKQTQALNSMYPQFETIPSIGGGRYRTGLPRPVVNTGASSNGAGGGNYLDQVAALQKAYPDLGEESIRQHIANEYGVSPVVDSRQYNPPARYPRTQDQEWMRQMQGIRGFAIPISDEERRFQENNDRGFTIPISDEERRFQENNDRGFTIPGGPGLNLGR